MKLFHQVGRFQGVVIMLSRQVKMSWTEERRWRGAFQRLPHEPNEKAAVEWNGVHLLIRTEWRPCIYPLRKDWYEDAERLRRSIGSDRFDDYLEAARESARFLAISGFPPWTVALKRHGIGEQVFTQFLRSDDFSNIPLVRVWTTLYAHLLNDRGRKLRNSDGCDLQILAMVLPYCDLVMTDSYMANAVKNRDLDRLFRVEVMGSGPSDFRHAAAYLDAV